MTPPMVTSLLNLRRSADRFEALTPPAQLSEWHLLNIEAYRMAQAVLDTQPTDDVIDFNNPTMNTAEDDFEEKLREAVAPGAQGRPSTDDSGRLYRFVLLCPTTMRVSARRPWQLGGGRHRDKGGSGCSGNAGLR